MLSSQSVLLLLTLGVKAIRERSTISPLPSQVSSALVATSHNQAQPSALWAGNSPFPPERGQIHNIFREAAEVCLGDCQVREESKDIHHLLYRYLR